MSSALSSITIHAGARALAQIRREGLRAEDISAIPAAAGGPKGLALIPLDKFLFGEWLKPPRRDGQPRLLIGSSVGSWRMAAAAQVDPLPALERMRAGYFAQRYPKKPSEQCVTVECGKTVTGALGESPVWAADRRLVVITSRSRGALREKYSAPRFAAAVLTNMVSRPRLARYFERVVFSAGVHDSDELAAVLPHDRFGRHMAELTPENRYDVLLASGTIPMIAAPVRSPAGAPPGLYWDGGMVDYHIDWNWQALPGLVLYPHFIDHMVPGWLDKHLKWRRARGYQLDNLVIVSPSADLLARLPRKKLPDREDFYHYGLDYAARIASWEKALGECGRMAEDFARFVERPDPALVLPI